MPRICWINIVTNRSILTAKHFLLAIGLYSITGMKQIIQILHKMGHYLSHDKIGKIETAMAETTLVRTKQSFHLKKENKSFTFNP